jgi:hypothetical protein
VSTVALFDLSVVGIGLGALLLLRLAGGSMPWGHLVIAVGPDGRPMRPKVRWHLWSVTRGESPWAATLAGFASFTLGAVGVGGVLPRLMGLMLQPFSPTGTMTALVFVAAMGCSLVPFGSFVLFRGAADWAGRRSTMTGMVVGLRRDIGLFGHAYHIAIQEGNRSLGPTLWAEAFRINRAAFETLRPGDKVTVEYSPRLRYVYRMEPVAAMNKLPAA